MKTYEGRRIDGGVIVTVNEHLLNPRFDLWNHSPTGFEWGYAGSGSAQLALALLADALENDAAASRWHQDFKRIFIVGLAHDGWSVTDEQIRRTFEFLVFESSVVE